ncbi:MAG: archease [Candidatus Korarchaeota archaeon]
MASGYKFIEGITSDVKVLVWGDSFEDILINAAKAMFAVMYDYKKPSTLLEVEVEGYDLEDALVVWLSTLLAEHDIRHEGFFEFAVSVKYEHDKIKIEGKAMGSPIRPEDVQTLVKGVTYHDLRVWKENNSFKAVLVFDI